MDYEKDFCNQSSANSMTIAWGSFGFLWNRPIVIVYVSEDRFTKHLMDENEYFTVTAFPQSLKCKKIYSDAFRMELLPAEEREGRYSRMGIHSFYIGEIVNIWEK